MNHGATPHRPSASSATGNPSPWNVPNLLTAARLVLAIVVFVLIPRHAYFAALVIFLFAAATDWIDGYWARRFGQVTQLGRIFDPFVDKIIIAGAYICLVAQPGSGVPAWMAVVVVARELLVTALRSMVEGQGGDFSAKMAGKLKMVFQCGAVVASLAVLQWGRPSATHAYGVSTESAWLAFTLNGFLWLSVISTVYSGAGYVSLAAKAMRK